MRTFQSPTTLAPATSQPSINTPPVTARGGCMQIVIRDLDNGKIAVKCPYSQNFVIKAQRLNGLWVKQYKLWVFDTVLLEEVKNALMAVYLTDGTPCERIAIKLTATKQLRVTRGSVTFNGIPVASAFGRKGGAKPSAGVSLISGEIHSGGTTNLWETVVCDGAEFILRDMPVAWLQQTDDDWIVEPYGEKTVDIDAYKIEKESLLKRLSEIDAVLNQL